MADTSSRAFGASKADREKRPIDFGSSVMALVVALGAYLGVTGTLLWLSVSGTGGEFVYAQDDPYIHLAIARTLAEAGVWGIRPDEFASASSSPLWTLLLACAWRLGAQQVWLPFALNLLFGAAAIAAAARFIGRHGRPRHENAGGERIPPVATLLALVFVTPLPLLAFIGMEHSLHVFLVVVFLGQASIRLAGAREEWIVPAIVATLMVGTRYESLFLVGAVIALTLWQRRFRAAMLLGVAAAAPVVAFATFSVAHGGLILPNSLLMKSGPARFATFWSGAQALLQDWVGLAELFRRPPQLALTTLVLLALVLIPAAALKQKTVATWTAVIFLVVSLLHACLVKTSWFYRYDAYLMAAGLMTCALLAPYVAVPPGLPRRRRTPHHPAVLPLVVLLALPLAARGLLALASTVPAVGNVFEQQVQLGRFFARYYPGRAVAINDLGAVAFLSTSPVLDVVGLASQPVADLKRRGALDANALDRLADAHAIAAVAVYEDIFADVLPADWIKVGAWVLRNNVAVAGDEVAFFARDVAAAEELRRSLEEFRRELPPGVDWQAGNRRIPASQPLRDSQP